MSKKVKTPEPEEPETEPVDEEPQEEAEQKPVRISKRTGKPVREISEERRKILEAGRKVWNEKRKELASLKNVAKDERRKKRIEEEEIVNTKLQSIQEQAELKIKVEYETKLKELEKKLEEMQKEQPKERRTRPKKVITTEVFTSDADTEAEADKALKLAKPKKEKQVLGDAGGVKQQLDNAPQVQSQVAPMPQRHFDARTYLGNNPFNRRF